MRFRVEQPFMKNHYAGRMDDLSAIHKASLIKGIKAEQIIVKEQRFQGPLFNYPLPIGVASKNAKLAGGFDPFFLTF